MSILKSSVGTGVVRDVLAPHRRRFALLMMLLVADGALNSIGIGMILPVMQAVLDSTQINPTLARLVPQLAALMPENRIAILCGATFGLFALRAATNYLFVYASKAFAEMLRVQWIRKIGENYLCGKYESLVDEKQGALLNNWQTETAAGSRFFVAYLSYLSAGLQTIALIALGLIVHWQVMLVLMAVGAILLILLRKTAFASAAHLGGRKLALHQQISAGMSENLSNARDIKLMGAENKRLGELQSLARSLRKIFIRLALLAALPRILGEFAAVSGLMVFIYLTIVVFDQSPATVLPLVAFFVIAFYRLITAASLLVGSRIRALNDLRSVELIHKLSSEADANREERDGGAPIASLDSDISFNDVSYAYRGDARVLHNVDFTIPRGSLTLLLGPSGSGKSTLLDLLLRLREPSSGRISVNGASADAFALSAWRKLFGYVSQDATLFNGTIGSNMLLAKPDACDQEIAEACQTAGIAAFIDTLATGYDTPVGDRGLTLSGGQRKRLAIARALVAKPQVLILDEATTSIEETMERSIINSIRKGHPDMTIIQVTHRVQMNADADHVVALEAGHLVAEGPWKSVKDKILPAGTIEKAFNV